MVLVHLQPQQPSMHLRHEACNDELRDDKDRILLLVGWQPQCLKPLLRPSVRLTKQSMKTRIILAPILLDN